MGPAATADFYRKVVNHTPAMRDQDHLPMLIHAVPQIADRAASILEGGHSPEDELVRGAQWLQDSGAAMLVMPCNTAHLWHAPIQRALRIPLLHIVDTVLDDVERLFGAARGLRLGLLATAATIHCNLYPARAAQSRPDSISGVSWLQPNATDQARWVDAGIRAVKANDMALGRELLENAARDLIQRGANAVLLACTEIPLALGEQSVPAVDTTDVLARATVQWAERHKR